MPVLIKMIAAQSKKLEAIKNKILQANKLKADSNRRLARATRRQEKLTKELASEQKKYEEVSKEAKVCFDWRCK